MERCEPYFVGLVHAAHADVVRLRPPPETDKLGRGSDVVQVINDVIEFMGFSHFA